VAIDFDPDYDHPAAGERITTAFAALFTSVESGVRLLVDEGRIELEVIGAGSNHIDARVLTPGRLDSHKGINVPGVILQTPAMTEKDEVDLRAGISMGVDIVGVSFAGPRRHARVRAAAVAAARRSSLVAKIEKPLAVDRPKRSSNSRTGWMVARGDLESKCPSR
jgi:pyruvate kinase